MIPNLFIAHLFHCYWRIDRDGGWCRANFIGTHKYVYLANIVTPFLGFALNLLAIKQIRGKNLSKTSNQKAELKLLYQSIFSTLTFTTWALLTLVSYHLTPMSVMSVLFEKLSIPPNFSVRAKTIPEEQELWTFIQRYMNQVLTFSGLLYFEGGLIMLLKFR